MVQTYSNIKYIYFIKTNGLIIYIGRSANPLARIRQHSTITKNLTEFTAEVYGPYEEFYANNLESAEIHKRKRSKYLISKTTTKYDNRSKKVSVKDHGSKTIFQFANKGKVKKMVCKYAN